MRRAIFSIVCAFALASGTLDARAQPADAGPPEGGDASSSSSSAAADVAPAGDGEERPEEPSNLHPTKLVIATKVAPPFSIKNHDGSWTGLSIELFRRIAEENDWQFEIVESDLHGMVEGVESGRYDAAVAAMTVTEEREEHIDFSHPFYTTGLGIAVSVDNDTSILGAVMGLFSWSLIRPLSALLGVLLVVGVVVWLFERKHNADQFGGTPTEGIGSGFWWSAVTMTTVGYGDKAPLTRGGRAVGLVWMFVSVVTISSFTASIASALTVSQLGSSISGPDDLVNVRVGSVEGTTSAAYLDRQHITYRPYSSPGEGLLAVAAGEIDAMVYDAPILRYHATRRFENRVRVLPLTFERQDYAIGLPTNSPYREQINRGLLHNISSDWWRDMLYEYLGR